MKWVKDRTSRFSLRPHYLPAELDSECEKLITDFLHERHGKIEYPVSTDDMTVLIETLTSDLDLYADLSNEEGEVEGVTDFFPGRRPKVRISKQLTLDPGMSNRFRTTLTHELGHVKFHTFMFDGLSSGELSEAPVGLFPLRLAEPGIEDFTQRFHRRTCRLGPCLDKINVLGITSGGFEVKFVE